MKNKFDLETFVKEELGEDIIGMRIEDALNVYCEAVLKYLTRMIEEKLNDKQKDTK